MGVIGEAAKVAEKGSRWPQGAAASRLPAISLSIRASAGMARLVAVSSGRGSPVSTAMEKRNLEDERIQKEISCHSLD
jgi:hypothetical protein